MPKTRLGQHFLQNQNVPERMLDYAQITNKDSVLEIGPGNGILTKALAKKAHHVTCIEIDDRLVKQLQTWIPSNVKVIHDDVMNIDFSQLPTWNKCVSNLPYQISSPFTFAMLQYPFDTAVLMYQKDFAKRMTATPKTKEYSRLTVHVYYKAKCRVLEHVPNTQFKPRPKVDSTIVHLQPWSSPPFKVKDESLFYQLTTQMFSHRRKKIRNSLSSLLGSKSLKVMYANQRVEELSPEEIGQLCNQVYNFLHS